MAEIIDGKKIAEEIKLEIIRDTKVFKKTTGITPGLAVILAGDDPASQSYVASKGKACERMGFFSITEKLPAGVSESELWQGSLPLTAIRKSTVFWSSFHCRRV